MRPWHLPAKHRPVNMPECGSRELRTLQRIDHPDSLFGRNVSAATGPGQVRWGISWVLCGLRGLFFSNTMLSRHIPAIRESDHLSGLSRRPLRGLQRRHLSDTMPRRNIQPIRGLQRFFRMSRRRPGALCAIEWINIPDSMYCRSLPTNLWSGLLPGSRPRELRRLRGVNSPV